MNLQSIKNAVIYAAVGILAIVGGSGVQAGEMVSAGWDLFQTLPGTFFGGAAFEGVPLGTFNFNSGTNGDFSRSIDPPNVFGPDTIIKRLEAAVPGADNSKFTNADLPGVPQLPGIGQAGGPPVFISGGAVGRVDLEVSALQLRSTMPINLGFGTGIYYETLQSIHGGPMGRGLMDITFGPEGIPHGMFNSWLYIPIDLRIGSATAPIVASDILLVTTTGADWSHFPPTGALLIGPQAAGQGGANYLLNGVDQTTDFWPGQTLNESITSVNNIIGQHVVMSALVPEPGSVVLLGLGVLGIYGYGWRRRQRAA